MSEHEIEQDDSNPSMKFWAGAGDDDLHGYMLGRIALEILWDPALACIHDFSATYASLTRIPSPNRSLPFF